jgi:hypothetical protein
MRLAVLMGLATENDSSDEAVGRWRQSELGGYLVGVTHPTSL